MATSYEKVRTYLQELELPVTREIPEETLFIVNDEDNGLSNLIIDCEDPLLIFEQHIMEVPTKKEKFYQRLLQMNRTLVHGAFALDDTAQNVFFRDTLQISNLDLNELESSIKAISLALIENGNELLNFNQQ